ncbi:excinuclease ATPase subunit [Myxococcus sp. RHSTA-1-4]|uniref:excinuclease ATPase subunit n=1 Tax=Myxococcus sp. RHSTA-1-4 TaxID=2874601 RepID=UPI001CBB6908|nr:excinuclease ATPase subunit [Myxococcus sp. RHSTA-1-4]MBZ4415716.1 excinuclease ATPase subunit [Myxococcus sp. RHSTA-1-4]
MKKAMTLALLALTLSSPAMARDTVVRIKLADVLKMPEAKSKLDGSVKFYLAGQKTPKVLEDLGSDVTNKKTNGMGKSDEVGCKWATLSALIALEQSAKKRGANAVVDIASYYKKNEVKSATEVECHAGSFVIGVALKGTYAKVPEKNASK